MQKRRRERKSKCTHHLTSDRVQEIEGAFPNRAPWEDDDREGGEGGIGWREGADGMGMRTRRAVIFWQSKYAEVVRSMIHATPPQRSFM